MNGVSRRGDGGSAVEVVVPAYKEMEVNGLGKNMVTMEGGKRTAAKNPSSLLLLGKPCNKRWRTEGCGDRDEPDIGATVFGDDINDDAKSSARVGASMKEEGDDTMNEDNGWGQSDNKRGAVKEGGTVGMHAGGAFAMQDKAAVV
ncbi:hypothetical protein PIB30_071662 [Stylosanthes scabra]|uniref:Uncharacterized protein n=1 Tax=Stylosanthes scabra TaxID=79078 RepID=A0ABU6RNS9_9FABA|nr:hypothetical protein [Stylosanthes scabra]